MLMAMLMAGYADDPYIYLFGFVLFPQFQIYNIWLSDNTYLSAWYLSVWHTDTSISAPPKLCSSNFLQTCPFSSDPLILPICPAEKLWDCPLFLCLSCFFFLLSPQKSEVHLQETAKECVAGLWFAKERQKERKNGGRNEQREEGEIPTKIYSLPPCKPLSLPTPPHPPTHRTFSIMLMKKWKHLPQIMQQPSSSPSGLRWRKVSPAGGSSHRRCSKLTPGELLWGLKQGFPFGE